MVERPERRNAAPETGEPIDMKHAAILIVSVAALAACNREPEVRAHNASVAEVAKKVADAGGADSFVRPGKWSSTVTIDEVSMPGMPPEAAAQMKQMAARTHNVESCLTPKDAKKPDPKFFSGKDNGCRYDNFTMAGGKIDMTMRCTGGHAMGAGNIMHMTGTYAPDEYHMAMENRTDTGTKAGTMVMKMHVDAKRVGECDAKAS
jgi:hypothetical protein